VPNPVQPARRGDPQPRPGTAPGMPTKEATTTHRSRIQPTPSAPGTGQGGTGRATADPTARGAAGATCAGVHPGGRGPGRRMASALTTKVRAPSPW